MVVPFEEYDFENDERYAAYLKNVELTGAPQEQAALLKRLQAKWYKNNVVLAGNRYLHSLQLRDCEDGNLIAASTADRSPEIEPLLLLSIKYPVQDPDYVPASTKEKAPEYHSGVETEAPTEATPKPGPTAPAQERTEGQVPSGHTPSPTKAPVSLIPGLNALTQAAMLFLAVVFLISLVMRNQSLNTKTYRIFLQAALTSHVLRLVATVGYPKLWPFNWPALQQWLARLSGTSDAHYASVCFMFASQPPTVAVMASPAIFAGLRLASYVRKNFPRILAFAMPLCDKINSNRELAFYSMAASDLSLLAVVIGMAFSRKAMLLPLVYINMLRHRYKSPVSAKYHQAMWAVLYQYLQPVLKVMPSPVHTGLGYLTRWFTGRTV